MQLRYVFTELGQGLRRNLSMHIAVVLTLFVSLTLVGLGVLLNQQADKAAEHWGNQLQITVWLCKDNDENPACTGEVTDAQKAAIDKVVEDNPEVAGYHTESKEEAFEKVKELLGPEKFNGPNPAATAEDMPESVWIELKDPEQYKGITSAVVGLDGVSGIRDMRAVPEADLRLDQRAPVGGARHRRLPRLRRPAAGRQHDPAGGVRPTAGDRHHAAGRRLDALHRAAVPPRGPGHRADRRGARGGRAGGLHVLRHPPACRGPAQVHPVDRLDEFTVAAVAVAVLGPLLTLLPTLVLTRKYLKV